MLPDSNLVPLFGVVREAQMHAKEYDLITEISFFRSRKRCIHGVSLWNLAFHDSEDFQLSVYLKIIGVPAPTF